MNAPLPEHILRALQSPNIELPKGSVLDPQNDLQSRGSNKTPWKALDGRRICVAAPHNRASRQEPRGVSFWQPNTDQIRSNGFKWAWAHGPMSP